MLPPFSPPFGPVSDPHRTSPQWRPARTEAAESLAGRIVGVTGPVLRTRHPLLLVLRCPSPAGVSGGGRGGGGGGGGVGGGWGSVIPAPRPLTLSPPLPIPRGCIPKSR